LNEAFANELGVKDGSIEQLRLDVKANLTREASTRVRAVMRARTLNSLLAANPIEVPRSLVDAELQRLKTAVKTRGLNIADEGLLEKRAYRQVALGLILGEIVRAKAIKPDPAEVRARIEEMAADYDSPQEYIQWHYASPERLSEVESLILEGKIVDDLLSSVEIADKPMSFQELMKTEVLPR
jgi:trigger factor